MIIGFGNNVVSALAADITTIQTDIPVMPGTGAKFAKLLSADFENKSNAQRVYAKITLTDNKESAFEICHLVSVSGDVLNVIRGQEGTTPKGWFLNDVVANFATRGSENHFVQIEQLQNGHYISGVAGGTANALTLELPATYFTNGGTDWTLRTPIVVYPTQNNTAASTLQLTMGGRVLGTFRLYKGNKAELVANDILKDMALVCLLDHTKTFFTILNPGGIYSSFVPTTRRVNGHPLSSDVDVTSQDIFNGQAIGLGNGVDLNTLTMPGIYYQPSNAQAQTGRNYPEGNAGSLMVLKAAGVIQIYTIYLGGATYTRTFYDNQWSAWSKQYDTYHKPTPAEIGAVNKSGDSMTGKLTLPQTSGFGVNTNNGLGGNSITLGDNDTGIKQNGDGILDVYANSQHVFRFTNGSNLSNKPLTVSGNCSATGEVQSGNGSARLASDGNVYGTAWGGWLSNYIQNRTGVLDIRLGAKVWFKVGGDSTEYGAGYVLTGGGDFGAADGTYFARPLQKLVNGTWYNVASV